MVSLLWKACSEGDFLRAQEQLEELNGVDIELKDYTGVTPLIEAVKNGHVEIVKLLLDKGADPTNASKDGRPEAYTSEPAILDLLQAAVGKTRLVPVPPPQSPYPHDTSDGTDKRFYVPPPPPPDAYIYYPPMNPNMNETAYYFPPSANGGPVSPNTGIGHLPPPEIARMIPCRYFPACRYGSQCIFLHPQGPYYQGAMPYPPFDPMANPYGPYYPPPPPPFQQPPSAHSAPPMTPPPNSALHNRSSSEVVSPVQPPFSPNGLVPPPPMYPPAPLPMQYPIPPPHQQPLRPHPAHHSPPNLYDVPPIVTPYPLQPGGSYPPQGPLPNGHYAEPLVRNTGENTPAENPTQPNGVNGNHHRRGSMRHAPFGSRKPPCLFFPSGRCRNGDECLFPHILPDGAFPTQPTFSQGKGGTSRPSRVSRPDGQGSLADKLSNLNLRDDQRPTSVEGSGRSENGHRLKFQANGKHHYQPGLNGHAKKSQPVKQQIQRVPNADEFPVLSGSVTPPKLVNGNGPNGPTAAQVLQAPPPARKDASKESSTRGPTPEPGGSSKESRPETNGYQEKVAPSDQQAPVSHKLLPIMSFAAATAASSVAGPDAVQEVSVSA